VTSTSISLTLKDFTVTEALGRSLAHAIEHHLPAIRAAGLQVNLTGDLGAGKTALVRAVLHALGVSGPIKSPTFALLEPYLVSSIDFYHFDFYRLSDHSEFGGTGFRDLFGSGRICAVEWPERAGPRLPTADISIALIVDGDGRIATINTASELGEACLQQAMSKMRAGDDGSSPQAQARSSSR